MGYDEVMGMHLRNLAYVNRLNTKEAILLVNDKLATKVALHEVGIPVPKTLAAASDRLELRATLENGSLETFALKPNSGSGGAGILLAARRENGGWIGPGGRWYSKGNLVLHAANIMDGYYARKHVPATAFFEELIRPDPRSKRLCGVGLPDVRVILYKATPVLSMMRVPTEASGGRANLHQGAVGIGVDLETGCATHAILARKPITRHPDTGEPLLGFKIPNWEKILRVSVECQGVTGMGYLGADIVLDESRGVLVLELNGRPGLDIQTANMVGLRGLLS